MKSFKIIFKIALLISITGLLGCVTAAKKIDLSEISDLKKCSALIYSYKNIGRNFELNNNLIVELKNQEANLNCSRFSKSQISNQAEINSILSRLNYDIYFGKTKEKNKADFLDAAKNCISEVDYEYINITKKFPELKNHYFEKPSSKNSSPPNFDYKYVLNVQSGNKYIDNAYNDLQSLANNRNIDLNSNLSIVDLEIMRCIADKGFCAHNDGTPEYSHTKKTGRTWDGKNFVNTLNSACIPDYCNPVNADLIMDVYPSISSILNICSKK